MEHPHFPPCLRAFPATMGPPSVSTRISLPLSPNTVFPLCLPCHYGPSKCEPKTLFLLQTAFLGHFVIAMGRVIVISPVSEQHTESTQREKCQDRLASTQRCLPRQTVAIGIQASHDLGFLLLRIWLGTRPDSRRLDRRTLPEHSAELSEGRAPGVQPHP